MNQPENLHIMNARPVREFATAIDQWLAARGEYQKQASDENRNAYNAAYFALGEAWAGRYPEAASSSGAFEWFRRGLIAPEDE